MTRDDSSDSNHSRQQSGTPGTVDSREEKGGTRLVLSGDWSLSHYPLLRDRLTAASFPDHVDLSGVTYLDTAGAALLTGFIGADRLASLLDRTDGLSPERKALLKAVIAAVREETAPQQRSNVFLDSVARLGEIVVTGWQNFILLGSFIGQCLATIATLILRPRHWRITALVVQLHHTGLNAVLIIALLTFLVGAVVAFLGATVLDNFGASIYTVDLVAYSYFREFGVLLTAILLAGRTASSFTAQIGSMKINEEIDALRTLGLDPVEVLVVPRVLALLVVLPLLTFIAVIAGLAGGGMVAVFALDISLARYLSIVQEVPLDHFLIGLSKAPFFAFLIAVIGCLEGFKVEGSARSVGEHTTSSVVQSIFVVILLDAIAALFFMEMGL